MVEFIKKLLVNKPNTFTALDVENALSANLALHYVLAKRQNCC